MKDKICIFISSFFLFKKEEKNIIFIFALPQARIKHSVTENEYN
jgi:hypothetical protein